MHPWDRLHRPATGERLWAPRPLEASLFARERDLREPTKLAVGQVKLPEVKIRKNQHTAQPKPNAPLLKRIVRHPYGMDGVRGKRAEMRSAVPWSELSREPLPAISSFTARQAASLPNPIADLRPMRIVLRERRPRVSAWIDEKNEGGRE